MKIYLISSIVPNSTINKDFFENLLFYKDFLKAELCLFTTQLGAKETFLEHNLWLEYLHQQDLKINDNLKVKNANLHHSVYNPIVGYYLERDCTIIPHPRQSSETISRQLKNSKYPRAIWATGTICNPDYYKNTKAQQKAKELHKRNGIGFLIVEVLDDKTFRCREVKWDETTKSFCDFCNNEKPVKIKNKQITEAKVLNLSTGDLHHRQLDKNNWNWTKKMVSVLNPIRVQFHDAFDGGSYLTNHHAQHDYINRNLVEDSIKQELVNFGDFLKNELNEGKAFKNVKHIDIVASNHNEFFDRLLQDEPRIRRVYQELADCVLRNDYKKYELLKETDEVLFECLLYVREGKNPLKEFIYKRFGKMKKVNWLDRGDSVLIMGVEFGNHGDEGANGAKGSPASISKIQPGETVTGHTHSPRTTPEGNHINGHLCIAEPEYLKKSGYSNWMTANTIQYENGKLQLIRKIGE